MLNRNITACCRRTIATVDTTSAASIKFVPVLLDAKSTIPAGYRADRPRGIPANTSCQWHQPGLFVNVSRVRVTRPVARTQLLARRQHHVPEWHARKRSGRRGLPLHHAVGPSGHSTDGLFGLAARDWAARGKPACEMRAPPPGDSTRTGRQSRQPIGAAAALARSRSPWSPDIGRALAVSEVGSRGKPGCGIPRYRAAIGR